VGAIGLAVGKDDGSLEGLPELKEGCDVGQEDGTNEDTVEFVEAGWASKADS
jgi:hypothetical protein